MDAEKADPSSGEIEGVPKKRRPRRKPLVVQTTTLRWPQWTYFHLSVFSIASDPTTVDIITVRQYLSSATTRFLGLIGSTIPVDILKLAGNDLWVRVPRDSSVAFHEAVSAWIGSKQVRFVVKGKSDWLASLACESAEDLFRDPDGGTSS
jgi:ribonuclease P/MRP protein subunit POP8